MITIKVGKRGQITIPRAIRKKFGLKQGDSLAMIQEDDQVVMRPITTTLLDLRGSVPVSGPQEFAVIRSHVIAERGKKANNHNG